MGVQFSWTLFMGVGKSGSSHRSNGKVFTIAVNDKTLKPEFRRNREVIRHVRADRYAPDVYFVRKPQLPTEKFEDRRVAELYKNKRQTIIVSLGGYYACPTVDIRVADDFNGQKRMTLKGIAIRRAQLPALIEALQKAQTLIEMEDTKPDEQPEITPLKWTRLLPSLK